MRSLSIKYSSIPIFAAMYKVNVTSQAQLPLVNGCQISGDLNYHMFLPFETTVKYEAQFQLKKKHNLIHVLWIRRTNKSFPKSYIFFLHVYWLVVDTFGVFSIPNIRALILTNRVWCSTGSQLSALNPPPRATGYL